VHEGSFLNARNAGGELAKQW